MYDEKSGFLIFKKGGLLFKIDPDLIAEEEDDITGEICNRIDGTNLKFRKESELKNVVYDTYFRLFIQEKILYKDDIDTKEVFNNRIFVSEIKEKKKKKVNSKRKGNRGELEIVHKFQDLFDNKSFRRVPNSGALVGAGNYNKEDRNEFVELMSGDIVVPSDFRYKLIEVKNYTSKYIQHDYLHLNGKDLAILPEDNFAKWIYKTNLELNRIGENGVCDDLMFLLVLKHRRQITVFSNDIDFVDSGDWISFFKFSDNVLANQNSVKNLCNIVYGISWEQFESMINNKGIKYYFLKNY